MPHLIHARIQDFFSGGGGGGPGPTARKHFFFLNLFYSLQKGSNGYITEKTIFFQGARGGPTFSRGSNDFWRGPNAHFYRNPYNLRFSRGGGVRTLYLPLWIRTCTYFINIWAQTARVQLDFQFLAQNFQIEEGGSQDFLIQNACGSTGLHLSKYVGYHMSRLNMDYFIKVITQV